MAQIIIGIKIAFFKMLINDNLINDKMNSISRTKKINISDATIYVFVREIFPALFFGDNIKFVVIKNITNKISAKII